MGNYLKYLEDNKIKFRFDFKMKEEGLIKNYEECNKLGMFVIEIEIMECSWAFVKSKNNYSSSLRWSIIDTLKALILCAYIKHISQLSRDILACLQGKSSYVIFYSKLAQIFQCLHNKRNMVVAWAEFG